MIEFASTVGTPSSSCLASLFITNNVSHYISIVPWGKKHKFSGDPEDEAYAADVERQMQVERDRQPESYTQLQPQGSDKVAVKNRECS